MFYHVDACFTFEADSPEEAMLKLGEHFLGADKLKIVEGSKGLHITEYEDASHLDEVSEEQVQIPANTSLH